MLWVHRRSKGSIEGCLACRGLGASGVVMGGVTLGDVAGYYAVCRIVLSWGISSYSLLVGVVGLDGVLLRLLAFGESRITEYLILAVRSHLEISASAFKFKDCLLHNIN